MTDHGFGVILDGEGTSEFKENACALLVDMIRESSVALSFEFEDYIKASDYTDSELDEPKIAFAEEFDDDEYGCGFEGLLAAFINEKEELEESWFVYRDSCLYIPARVPYDEESKNAMLTVKDIERILAQYLNPLLKNGPCSPTWVDVYM